jgi:hypothetical protein
MKGRAWGGPLFAIVSLRLERLLQKQWKWLGSFPMLVRIWGIKVVPSICFAEDERFLSHGHKAFF